MLFSSVEVIENTAAITELLSSKDGDIARWLLRLGGDVQSEVRLLLSNRMVNVDTGRLRSSIAVVLVRDGFKLAVYVGSNVEYALYVHDSGRPYLTTGAGNVLGRQ